MGLPRVKSGGGELVTLERSVLDELCVTTWKLESDEVRDDKYFDLHAAISRVANVFKHQAIGKRGCLLASILLNSNSYCSGRGHKTKKAQNPHLETSISSELCNVLDYHPAASGQTPILIAITTQHPSPINLAPSSFNPASSPHRLPGTTPDLDIVSPVSVVTPRLPATRTHADPPLSPAWRAGDPIDDSTAPMRGLWRRIRSALRKSEVILRDIGDGWVRLRLH